MTIIKLIKLIFFINLCYAEFGDVDPYMPHLPPLPSICAQPQYLHQGNHFYPHQHSISLDESEEKIEFLLPFMDMEMQPDRNLLIMQEEFTKEIFVLHGQDFYQLFFSRQYRKLVPMAILYGGVRYLEPLGAQIIYWQGNVILVVALQEYLEVYQLPEFILKRRGLIYKHFNISIPPPFLEPIQQIPLMGRFQQIFLFSPAEEQIMMIAAFSHTITFIRYRSFKWVNTYFDVIQEEEVHMINLAKVVGTKTKYFIISRSIPQQNKSVLQVYRISAATLMLQKEQVFIVESKVVHIFTYRNHSMIVACSSENRECSSFKQSSDGRFRVYRKRASNDLAFNVMASAQNFVAATHGNQVIIFTNHRLDCYGSFTTDAEYITLLIGYHNLEGEDYVFLIYPSFYKTIMRIIELKITVKDLATDDEDEPEEMLASTRQQRIFETSVGELRSVLLQRKMDMDVIRNVSNIMTPKIKEMKVTEPVTLHSGKVGIIHVKSNKTLRSPLQILQRIINLTQMLTSQRAKRSKNVKILNTTYEIANHIKVKKLKVENLIYQGDVIEGFHLNHTNKETEPILYVKPKVKTFAVNTSELILPGGGRTNRQLTIPDLFSNLRANIRVNHLKLDSINGVRWNEFLDSLFLNNRDKMIQGRLVMQSQVNVKHLMTTNLNGLIVSNLFNLKHPQVVHSDLLISHFFVSDLKAKTINSLVFEEDIVFSGNDTFIETPVIIRHLKISGNLFLANDTKVERIANNPDKLELKQFYTNRVMINGSLLLNNLKRERGNETKIFLADLEYNESDLKTKYLLRKKAQNFSFPIKFDGSQVTAPYLETNYLNDHITEQHMLVNVANDDKPLLVVFMNATVHGDIICQDYKSKIAKINENIIRQNDTVANISGLKTFEASLEANELNASHLNHIAVEDFVFKSLLNESEQLFKDLKLFVNIKVKNPAIITGELEASYLNSLPLEDLLNNDYYMDRLQVPYLVETSNIVFHKINGIPFDDFFKKINVSEQRLVLHKDLIVEGNVEFKEPLELHYLNEIDWNQYVANLVRINENAVIEGDVSFLDDLTITNEFETSDINGSDLEIILKSILMKSKPQMISGSYRFDNINASNIDVLNINRVNVKELMDLSNNLTEFKGDIIVENLYVQGNLQANIIDNGNYSHLSEQVKRLPFERPWKNIYVLNNASWPLNLADNSQQELLKYFYKHAVKSNQDQLITGNVKLTKPLITKMQTRLKFPADVDIDFIQQDALLKNTTVPQIVKGEKVFVKPLYFDNLKANNYVYAKLLNNIDILYLNQSLYRLSRPITLHGSFKFIKPLRIEQLQVNGLINGLNSSLIYQLNPHTKVPALKLSELYIDNNLKIKKINHMSMEYFLENRVTLQGPALEHFGILTFENLVIEKEALMQSINNIAIDNLVIKHSDHPQTITGHKNISKHLELAGPAHVMRINNKDLVELYHNFLLKDQNYQFDNLVIDKATFDKGLQVVKDLNTNLQQRTSREFEELKSLSNREDLLRSLKELNNNLSSATKDILYLDYDLNSLIKWQRPDGVDNNNTILYELARISYCEKAYLQIFLKNSHEVYLQNNTSNRLSVITNRISAKAENFCRDQYRKVKSKITISGPIQQKVFGMKRYVETIHTLNIDNHTDLVILHALDLPSLKRNEVRIFKIHQQNNSIDEWQDLIENIGEKLKLFKLTTSKVLITNGLIKNHPALTIYHFNDSTHQFRLHQTIDGDHDIIEMLELPSGTKKTKHLIVSCSKCQRIFIYELNATPPVDESKYEIFQIIVLQSAIDKLVVFRLQNDFYMLVISQGEAIFYDIYKYSYIQGWLRVTFGYFPNLQMCVPLTEVWRKEDKLSIYYDSNDIPLLLLCNFDNCYLVKAII